MIFVSLLGGEDPVILKNGCSSTIFDGVAAQTNTFNKIVYSPSLYVYMNIIHVQTIPYIVNQHGLYTDSNFYLGAMPGAECIR